MLDLAPGETREIVVVLGAADDEAQAKTLVTQYRDVTRAKRALSDATEAWGRRLSAVTVRTPEPTFDAMINRGSLYQAWS
jgi:cyclic beta-1,2-glucan synthetase